jgi:hypothetical protein
LLNAASPQTNKTIGNPNSHLPSILAYLRYRGASS